MILTALNFWTSRSPDQSIWAVQHQLRQRETPRVLQQAHLQQIRFFCTTLCLHLCFCWIKSDWFAFLNLSISRSIGSSSSTLTTPTRSSKSTSTKTYMYSTNYLKIDWSNINCLDIFHTLSTPLFLLNNVWFWRIWISQPLDLQINRFEQFNINYANEKLQEYFNKHIFSLEQLEYQSEGLEWVDIAYQDNGECLDLVEKVIMHLLTSVHIQGGPINTEQHTSHNMWLH